MNAVPICEVEARDVYGATLLYPVSRAAVLLAALTGKKTLDARDLAIASEFGAAIVVNASHRIADDVAVRVSAARARLGKELA